MHLPESPITPSTRHRVVDDQFAAVLEKDFGIPTAFILRAFKGEPCQPAIALCRLATRFEERNGTLLMLARKFGRGRARRRRTNAAPPRGHGQTSPRPSVERSHPDRGYGTRRPGDVAPDRVATRPGVG
jgi:hypothetical protein